MERTIARVTTMQSVNAKASKMEQNAECLCEASAILDDNENFPSIFALDDMSSFAANHLIDPEGSTIDQLEEMAAFFVLAAQKERESGIKRSRDSGIS